MKIIPFLDNTSCYFIIYEFFKSMGLYFFLNNCKLFGLNMILLNQCIFFNILGKKFNVVTNL